MTDLTAKDFPVSAEQQQRILQAYLEDVLKKNDDLKPHDVPQVVFIGGQPGSGKSKTINNVLTNMGVG